MTKKVRRPFLEAPSLSSLREDAQEMLDEGWVTLDDRYTAVLDPERFKRPDHGFPEDDHELKERMIDNHEWLGAVMRNIPPYKWHDLTFRTLMWKYLNVYQIESDSDMGEEFLLPALVKLPVLHGYDVEWIPIHIECEKDLVEHDFLGCPTRVFKNGELLIDKT
jgi:hypothetical protein